MIKKILFGLGAVVAVILVVAAFQPSDFKISRTTTIDAPADKVFPLVNDLHKWEQWSPWAKLDPNAKMSYEGPEAGVGAGVSWAGNSDVGEGKMTILESTAPSLIRINLAFVKPFAGNSEAQFTFASAGPQTTVTWAMSGKNNFISKIFCMFMNMDKMVGGDFEKGLTAMKAIAEQGGPK
jgi:uncharacterized protein YndB with AHSA1/START domain